MPRFPVETVHKSIGAAAVIADAKSITKATRETTAARKGLNEETKKGAQAQKNAAAKADLLLKRQAAINRVMRETGVSAATARKSVNLYGAAIGKQGAAAVATARKLDVLEKETRQLAAAQRQAQATGKGLRVSIAGLQGAYAALAGAAGVVATVRAVSSAVTAWENQARVNLQVETRLASMGGRLGITADQIADFADEFQRSTGIANEETQQLAVQFATFGNITKEAFFPALELSADMAEVWQKDVREGALQMAKALDDPVRGLTALRRSGTRLEAEQEELVKHLASTGDIAGAQAVIISELTRQYGGAAKAAREAGGTTKALGTEIADLSEEVGRLVLEDGGLGDFLEVLIAATRKARETGATISDLGSAAGQVGQGVNIFADAWGFLNSQMDEGAEVINRTEQLLEEQQAALSGAIAEQERWAPAVEEGAVAVDLMQAALDREAKAMKERQALMERGAALTKSLATEQEQMAEKLAEASALFAAGEINVRTMQRALEAYAPPEVKAKIEELAVAHERLNAALLEGVMAANQSALTDPSAVSLGGLPAPGLFVDIEKLSKKQAALDKENAEDRHRALEETEHLWFAVADAAFDAADSIGGRWGDMLGGIVDSVLGIRDAFGRVQAAQGGLGTLTAGFGLGQQAGGLAGGLGISAGPGQAGGLLSGIFGAAGTAAFGPIGGAIGGVVGEIIGSLKIFQQGGDTATAAFELNAGRLEGVTTKLEGGLGAGIEQFSGTVAQVTNSILASLGGFVGPGGLADIDIKIRQEGDETLFQVRRFGKTIAKFADEASAVTAAVKVILQESDIQGLTENVSRALAATTAATFEELSADLQVALAIDEALMTDVERFASQSKRALRESLSAVADLNLNMNDFFEVQVQNAEAAARVGENQALALAGVDTSAAAGRAAFDQLRAEAAAQDLLNTAIQEAAAALSSAGETVEGQLLPPLEELDEVFGQHGREWDRIRERVEQTGESVEVAARAIEGMDLALIERSAEAFEAMQLSRIVGEIAEFTGNAELAAEAARLESFARRIQIELMFEQARALGLLNPILEETIRGALAAVEAAGGAEGGARPGGGRGSSRRRERREAAESFAEAVAEINTQLALADAEALSELADKAAAAGASVEATTAALSALAELQLGEITAGRVQETRELGRGEFGGAFVEFIRQAREDMAQAMANAAANPAAFAEAAAAIQAGLDAQLASLGQEGLDALGSPFRALRQEFGETARSVRFMLNHLDELGLTAQQVANTVRGAVLPGLLDSLDAIAAQHAGTEEGAKLAEEVAARRQILERTLFRIQFENEVRLLEIAGAMTPALQAMVDTARGLLDVSESLAVTVPAATEGSSSGQFASSQNARDAVERAAAEAAAQGAQTVGQTVAEIMEQMAREAETPTQRAARAYLEMLERIDAATGTAAEKAEAAAAAQIDYAEALEAAQEAQVAGLRAIQQEVEASILSRQPTRQRVIGAKGAFEAARAAFASDPSEATANAFEAAIRDYQAVVQAYDQLIGPSTSGIVTAAEAAIAAALAATLPALPGADPGTVPAPPATTPGAGASPPPTIIVQAPAPVVPGFEGLQADVAAIRENQEAFEGEVRPVLNTLLPVMEGILATN